MSSSSSRPLICLVFDALFIYFPLGEEHAVYSAPSEAGIRQKCGNRWPSLLGSYYYDFFEYLLVLFFCCHHQHPMEIDAFIVVTRPLAVREEKSYYVGRYLEGK